MVASLPNQHEAAKTPKIYDGLYHEVFNEPERERALRDVETWLAVLPRMRFFGQHTLHGLASSHVTILQGDLLANQGTLIRLIREATALK